MDDKNKKFNDLESYMKNFDLENASKLLSDTTFVTDNARNIISLLGTNITEDNFKHKPDCFNFCEEQLLKMALQKDSQEQIFDFLECIDMEGGRLSSCVLISVTVLENTESLSQACLEFFLLSTFNRLNEMNENDLKDILPIVVKHLTKLNEHLQHDKSMLYYFARVAFFVLRANIDPIDEYIKILSNIICDPFLLLEYEFTEMQEYVYLASFFYLYFKTGILWGPKIYNRLFVLEKCFHLALNVFENNDFGKSFAKLILAKYKNNEIPLHLLNKCHEHFIIEASHCSVYSDQIEVRKDSIESLMIYMDKLCCDAQYIVLKSSFLKSIDSCVKAQLITKMKDLILLKIRTRQNLGYFQGERLMVIIRSCCDFVLNPECELIKIKEYILAVISLLYVLYFHKDGELKMENAFSSYIKQFVNKLHYDIDIQIEMYRLESTSLGSNKNSGKGIMDTIDFVNLPDSEKRELLSQYITSFKLIQSNLKLLKCTLKS